MNIQLKYILDGEPIYLFPITEGQLVKMANGKTLEEALEEIGTTIGLFNMSIEQVVTLLGNKLDKLALDAEIEKVINDTKALLDTKLSQSDLDGQLDDVKTSMNNLESKYQDVERFRTEFNQILTNLQDEKVDKTAFNNKVAELNTSIDNHVATLNNTIGQLQTKVDGMILSKVEKSEFNTTITELRGLIDGATGGNLQPLLDRLDGTDTKIAALETRIAELEKGGGGPVDPPTPSYPEVPKVEGFDYYLINYWYEGELCLWLSNTPLEVKKEALSNSKQNFTFKRYILNENVWGLKQTTDVDLGGELGGIDFTKDFIASNYDVKNYGADTIFFKATDEKPVDPPTPELPDKPTDITIPDDEYKYYVVVKHKTGNFIIKSEYENFLYFNKIEEEGKLFGNSQNVIYYQPGYKPGDDRLINEPTDRFIFGEILWANTDVLDTDKQSVFFKANVKPPVDPPKLDYPELPSLADGKYYAIEEGVYEGKSFVNVFISSEKFTISPNGSHLYNHGARTSGWYYFEEGYTEWKDYGYIGGSLDKTVEGNAFTITRSDHDILDIDGSIYFKATDEKPVDPPELPDKPTDVTIPSDECKYYVVVTNQNGTYILKSDQQNFLYKSGETGEFNSLGNLTNLVYYPYSGEKKTTDTLYETFITANITWANTDVLDTDKQAVFFKANVKPPVDPPTPSYPEVPKLDSRYNHWFIVKENDTDYLYYTQGQFDYKASSNYVKTNYTFGAYIKYQVNSNAWEEVSRKDTMAFNLSSDKEFMASSYDILNTDDGTVYFKAKDFNIIPSKSPVAYISDTEPTGGDLWFNTTGAASSEIEKVAMGTTTPTDEKTLFLNDTNSQETYSVEFTDIEIGNTEPTSEVLWFEEKA